MWEEPLALPRPSLDARDFRSALGCFPTGVCVVTAHGSVAMTINSFSSVSLDPPMILWSLARTASSAAAFRDAEHFVINVLAAGDEELSSHFARPGHDKFAKYADRFVNGVLHGAAATFECHSRHRYYGGDHIIIIGVVERYSYDAGVAPLTFRGGRYVTAA
jgi:flavin reductase (DIM6/NTAB) family NADH-FMN oxidoreductase RutF